MKLNLIKTANGKWWPADEESVDDSKGLKVGEAYSFEVKLVQNFKLLQKMHVFFKYCATYYFGDENVNKLQVNYTKEGLLISAGYCDTVFDPRTGYVKQVAKSISYGKMKEEERRECYKKLVTAACKDVFGTADDETWNKLMSFF